MFKRQIFLTILIIVVAACAVVATPEPRTGDFTLKLDDSVITITVENGEWVPNGDDSLIDTQRGLSLRYAAINRDMDSTQFILDAYGPDTTEFSMEPAMDYYYYIVLKGSRADLWIMFRETPPTYQLRLSSEKGEDLEPYFEEFVAVAKSITLAD